MSDFVQHHSSKCSFTSSNSWVILSPIEQSIKNKIEAVGKPLKKWDVNIYRGVLTGCNDAFIISTEKRDEILNNCADIEERTRTEALIRPILRGRDIKRYGYEWANLWLIATFPSRQYDIDEYPAVKNYLLTFAAPMLRANDFGWVAENHLQEYCYKRLEQTGKKIIINEKQISFRKNEGARKKTNNKWFETQDNISYWDDFSKPKIVWGNLNLRASYSMVEEDFFVNAPSPMIVPGNGFLLAILNSKLSDYYIRRLGVTRNGGYFEYKPMFIERLPIPTHVDDDVKRSLETLVKEMDEHEIDNLVFSIYNLNAEEIDFINVSSNVSKLS